jgi:hypothetical protein
MLLSEKIIIHVIPKNFKHYKDLNYDCKCGDIIEINTLDLPTFSKKKIDVKCDNIDCNNIKTICYCNYIKNITNDGYYSCSNKCSIPKFIKTNQERYGTDHYNKLPEFRYKGIKTKIELYGENYYSLFLDKYIETCQKLYGKDFYTQTEEYKKRVIETNLILYGVEHPLQNKDILEKMYISNIEIYGFKTPLQNEEIKQKISDTKEERYGDKNYNNREQYKITNNLSYSVDNPMQNDIIKNKQRNGFFKKYGVYHPSQVPEFYEKCIKSGYSSKQFKDTNLYYQGTYELNFLNKYYDKFTIIRGLPITYIFEDKTHIYYPDFFIKELNLIIEIKSDRWYNKDLEMNLEKEKTCKKVGYNYLFIINKDYTKFEEFTSK